MYYDLIYTRCRHGLDILRNGQPIIPDGFKVYSCSADLYKRNITDLAYLISSVQGKQSFREPNFMDDAYLYSVPENGLPFLNCFHPVPYDLSVTGDFAKRPGLYLNHAIVGDYSSTYPFEFFHDDSVWTGQRNNEAYYYENEPTDMPARDLDGRRDFDVQFDRIGSFIMDGRREALQKAVAFLVNEYLQPQDKRKYLVIKDDSSENIELWISAIELAFSPRIAASIPFATRMDRYTSTNLYYVNQDGKFAQAQSSNANTSPRLRAMIVGVVTKDTANSVRIIEGAPYVILDGTRKETSYEGDAGKYYFRLISSFDDDHKRFITEFLQSFELSLPSKGFPSFASAYQILCCSGDSSPKEYASALAFLSAFKMQKTPIMEAIYRKVNRQLDAFVKDSIEDALPVLQWVANAAELMGDKNAQDRLSDVILNRAREVFFTNYEKNSFELFWDKIKDGPFEQQIQALLSDEVGMLSYSKTIRSYAPEDAASFAEIYSRVCADAVKNDTDSARLVIASCAAACAKEIESEAITGVVEAVREIKKEDTLSFLFDSVQAYESASFGAFVTALYWNSEELHSDVNAVLRFCKLLADYGKADSIGNVLAKYAGETGSLKVLEWLAEQLPKLGFIPDASRAKIFSGIDARVIASERTCDRLAEIIQRNKPADSVCPMSAHVCALSALQRMSRRDRISDVLAPYVQQGFPSADDRKYSQTLAGVVCRLKLAADDRDYLVPLFANSSAACCGQLFSAMLSDPMRNSDLLNGMICYAANSRSKKMKEGIRAALVNALVESGMKKRNMEAVSKLLTDNNAADFYLSAVEEAAQSAGSGDSVMSKLFGGFKK